MSKQEQEKKVAPASLRDDEFNSGVGKILLTENENLKKEVKNLKKSLASVQDAFEASKTQNHELDKKNSILDYRLTNAFIPEILKFLASAFGAAFAVGFFFEGKPIWAVGTFVTSIFVYAIVLLVYRK
jgi:hypothetical protein